MMSINCDEATKLAKYPWSRLWCLVVKFSLNK